MILMTVQMNAKINVIRNTLESMKKKNLVKIIRKKEEGETSEKPVKMEVDTGN